MIINFQGIRIQTSDVVYTPAEDSFFMQDVLTDYFTQPKNRKNISHIAEMGCGTGYNLITLHKLFPKGYFVAIDKNPYALELTENNLFLNNLKSSEIIFYHSDLFSQVPKQLFDLIIFNPPYLPVEDAFSDSKEEDLIRLSWEGGANIINEFLMSAQDFLSNNGLIFIIISHFQLENEDIAQYIEKKYPNLFIVSYYTKKIALETLYLLILKKSEKGISA